MGSKITIDSATLMNKGLEVIEAHHLFGIDYDHIDVVIHPESVVHSMVETIDGALYAHMGVTDMAFPMLNALTLSRKGGRTPSAGWLEEVGALTFRACDRTRYPALDLCYAGGAAGRHAAGGAERGQRGGGRGVPGRQDSLHGHRAGGGTGDGESRVSSTTRSLKIFLAADARRGSSPNGNRRKQ